MTTEELKENFAMLGEDDEKFSYIIELGKQLPPYPDDKRDDTHKIYGCSSNVWFDVDNSSGKYSFLFDSDALIVRGLLYIIGVIFNGKSLPEIKSIDATKFFDELGLKSILSNQRQVGLLSIIKKIQDLN